MGEVFAEAGSRYIGGTASRWEGAAVNTPPEQWKELTLRLSRAQHEEIRAVAEAENVPVSEVIREAIFEHVEKKRKDEAFRARLRASIERNQRILRRLAE